MDAGWEVVLPLMSQLVWVAQIPLRTWRRRQRGEGRGVGGGARTERKISLTTILSKMVPVFKISWLFIWLSNKGERNIWIGSLHFYSWPSFSYKSHFHSNVCTCSVTELANLCIPNIYPRFFHLRFHNEGKELSCNYMYIYFSSTLKGLPFNSL